jgi:hypothetical protein
LVQDKVSRENICKCKKNWRVKGGREEHNFEDACEDFKMKMPKN